MSNHIIIKSFKKIVNVNFDDILYLKSRKDYIEFFTTSKKHIMHGSMKNMEVTIQNTTLAKVHRSYIVNLARVEGMQKNKLIIEGIAIPVSKRNRAKIACRFTDQQIPVN